MAQHRYITVNDDGSLSQDITSIGPEDKVHWQPESDDTEFTITFPMATPVDFKKKKNQRGKELIGKVNKCVTMGDRFQFTNGSRLIAQPELIVDGGLGPKGKGAGKKKRGAKKR